MVAYCSARCLLRVAGSNRVLVKPQRLMSALGVRPIESRPLTGSNHPSIAQPYRRYLSSSPSLMSSLDQVTQALAALSIKPAATISHSTTNSHASWKDVLSADASSPKTFELIKTIVYKPKTAKNVTPVPVVVIAREETETASGALGKKLNLKELRLASEDLLSEFFALDKNSRAQFTTMISTRSLTFFPRCSLSDRPRLHYIPQSHRGPRLINRTLRGCIRHPRQIFQRYCVHLRKGSRVLSQVARDCRREGSRD